MTHTGKHIFEDSIAIYVYRLWAQIFGHNNILHHHYVKFTYHIDVSAGTSNQHLEKQDIKRHNQRMAMPLKRASRGRQKGGKGSSGRIQCTNCGATVPRDKAKKITSRLNLVEHTLAKELRAQGAYIAAPTVLKWYCISCAIHFGILKIRSADSRRNTGRLR